MAGRFTIGVATTDGKGVEMQVQCGLKSVELHEENNYVSGWDVVFTVVVHNGLDFDLPVFVSNQSAMDETVVKVAYERMHEVASSLVEALGNPA